MMVEIRILSCLWDSCLLLVLVWSYGQKSLRCRFNLKSHLGFNFSGTSKDFTTACSRFMMGAVSCMCFYVSVFEQLCCKFVQIYWKVLHFYWKLYNSFDSSYLLRSCAIISWLQSCTVQLESSIIYWVVQFYWNLYNSIESCTVLSKKIVHFYWNAVQFYWKVVQFYWKLV